MPGDPQKARQHRKLEQPKKAASRSKLLASSKLSDAKIREVIRCYAFARSPAEAIARTGLSHVTIYRLYGLIRQRLAFFDVLISKEKFVDFINEGEEENGLRFKWEEFERFIQQAVGNHRGIKPHNRALYVSEAIYRFEGHHSPQQLYRLIMMTIRAGGPLNRAPAFGASWPLTMEIIRLNMLRARAVLRRGGVQSELAWLLPALNAFEERAGRPI
ncbi:hypothetical protein [Methylobacterium dankookense]|uniref:Uncharacterized protein n=1 Tax=Methylobacterium dankookense TaxID=560405 RepID=A0A564G6P5_9HYPH|nr:hypothetical protein [Methylobacterium dankookense]GJD57228.1 hypothetical protein IFDJLNFL_3129 [Methylobacterium dankookense]VUF15704.1 hypothetical protein MTDSW087_05448 [Methylobacterium dankookense]